ncbi:MAG: type II toxin-antitoxin system RelE/ParE family toxin [Atopobiaceae bacterium]|nr:type II toxin-antitoxin system RelE/ParE family toxin [Atopobiaceae bacterium]
MAYSVVIAGPAERDLDHALGYIANVLAAPGAASALLDEFERLLVLLADNPSLFGVDFDVSEAVAARVRHCMVKGYEVYYQVDEASHRVLVLALLHGSRDAVRIMTRRL